MREREKENRELDTFDEVGKDGRGLEGFKAIKWLDGARGMMSLGFGERETDWARL